MTVTGDFPQTATGNLNIEIGGRIARVEYDQLKITGAATLSGALNIQLINGFRPVGGDSFEIIRYNSHVGAFDHIVGLNIGGGFLFPIFSATNVVLTTIDTRPRIVFQSAEFLSGEQVEFTLSGTAGQDFVIEAATNLTAATWIPRPDEHKFRRRFHLHRHRCHQLFAAVLPHKPVAMSRSASALCEEMGFSTIA